jgi:hypothetical protein
MLHISKDKHWSCQKSSESQKFARGPCKEYHSPEFKNQTKGKLTIEFGLPEKTIHPLAEQCMRIKL